MKKLNYLFPLIAFVGCTAPAVEVDKRPKSELAFIKEITTADSLYSSQKNDVAKKEVLDSYEIKIPGFIKNNLNAKAEHWNAVIESIKVGETGEPEVTLRISKGIHFEDKNPVFSSIVLKSSGIYEDGTVKKSLKNLQPGDRVFVSGKFTLEKDITGENIGPYDVTSINPDEILNNPLFDFIITDIKKNRTH